MSIKDIEYASLLLNKSAQILFKKIDMDMAFLNTILDNKTYLGKKITEIQENITLHADLLSLGHKLSIEYIKMSKKEDNELSFILNSILVPFARFKKIFSDSKTSDEINKIYKEFVATVGKLVPKTGKHEFINNKLVIGGDVYAGGFRSELLLADLQEKYKHNMDDDTLVYIMKDILNTDNVTDAVLDLTKNFSINHIVALFKIDELFAIQLDRYNSLPIQEYFDTQRSKYLTNVEKPIVIGGLADKLKDYLPELINIDIDCVDDLLTQYIITITNISNVDELKNTADELIAMLEDDAINQYKYRTELKKEIYDNMQYITNCIADSTLTNIIPAVIPDNNHDIIQFLIKALTDLMPTITQAETMYDECAKRLATIISAWETLIGPEITPCIKHAEYTIKVYIGSVLLQVLTKTKFNNDEIYQRMVTIQNRLVPLIGDELLPIYNNKFIWDNIKTNISSILSF